MGEASWEHFPGVSDAPMVLSHPTCMLCLLGPRYPCSLPSLGNPHAVLP